MNEQIGWSCDPFGRECRPVRRHRIDPDLVILVGFLIWKVAITAFVIAMWIRHR
jgi:hypothetical protein